MKKNVSKFLPLVILLSIIIVFQIPRVRENKQCEAFAAPLFTHALPEGASVIQSATDKNDDGAYTAALILETDLDSEALEAFYSDGVYAPAEEGQSVDLSAKPLDEASLESLKRAKRYKDGCQYQFVYIYSE